jgi:signal transduction histidine kinase
MQVMPGRVLVPPRRRDTAVDGGLAALLWGLDLLVSWDHEASSALLSAVPVPVLAVVGYLPLVWRRIAPRSVLALTVFFSLLLSVLVPGFVPTLSVWCALYTVASRCVRRDALIGLALCFVPIGVNTMVVVRAAQPKDRLDAFLVATLIGTMLNLAAFGVGRWVAWSIAQRRLVAEFAAAEATAEERSRIARDLHDVVAHALSLMVLQAGGAGRLLRSDPARAENALRQVDVLGQQAVVELRRMLGLLAPVHEYQNEPATRPGIDDLDQLVASVRATGRAVELTVEGVPNELEPGVDLSAYRILQEALTNSVKYSDDRNPVEVAVHWFPNQLELSVVNSVPNTHRGESKALSTGHGIVGMRERAKASGGNLEADLTTGNRFAVTARLPVAAPPSDAVRA